MYQFTNMTQTFTVNVSFFCTNAYDVTWISSLYAGFKKRRGNLKNKIK